MKTRDELTVLFTSIGTAFKEFMSDESVSSDGFFDKFDAGTSIVREITQDMDEKHLANLMFNLVNSEAARQQFYRDYNIPFVYAYT